MNRTFGVTEREVVARYPTHVVVKEWLKPIENGPFVVLDDKAEWVTRELWVDAGNPRKGSITKGS